MVLVDPRRAQSRAQSLSAHVDDVTGNEFVFADRQCRIGRDVSSSSTYSVTLGALHRGCCRLVRDLCRNFFGKRDWLGGHPGIACPLLDALESPTLRDLEGSAAIFP